MSKLDLYLFIAIAQLFVSLLALFEFLGEWKGRGKSGRQTMRIIISLYFIFLSIFGILIWMGAIK